MAENGSGPLTYAAFIEYMENFEAKQERRYAAKWVEKAVTVGGTAIILAVLYALLGHVGIAS